MATSENSHSWSLEYRGEFFYDRKRFPDGPPKLEQLIIAYDDTTKQAHIYVNSKALDDGRTVGLADE